MGYQFNGQDIAHDEEGYLTDLSVWNPQLAELIAKDECWRKTALTIYDRGQFYLKLAANAPNLGIDDAAIRTLADDPTLKAEIDELRKLQGCK